MTNWQMFKVVDVGQYNRVGQGPRSFVTFTRIKLDKHVEYANGYEKHIDVVHYGNVYSCGNTPTVYIEIDIDKTKCERSSNIFSGVIREVPRDVVNYNLALVRTSSLNPEISAIVNDGIGRMNRGEIREFEHQIEDRSGNTHRFIYRK